jgi:hypothetical protein
VEPLSIVIDLDIFKQMFLRLSARGETLAVHCLDFQAVIPTFHCSIVVTIAPRAHAATKSMLIEQFPILLRAVLTATIRMHDDALRVWTLTIQ